MCTSLIPRAKLAGTSVPGRVTQARQVEGEKSDKYSEKNYGEKRRRFL